MRSIRLSLIVYFLVLLALGLGAVCSLFYFTTVRTLDQKEESSRKLFAKEFQDKSAAAQAAFDNHLVHQARVLAARTRSSSVFFEPFLALGALAAPSGPQGHLTVPLWTAEGFYPPLAFRLNRIRSSNIFLEGFPENGEAEDPKEVKEVKEKKEPKDPQYFQLFRGDNQKLMLSSDSLRKFEFSLTKNNLKAALFSEHLDTQDIHGKKIRRVTFKGTVPESRIGTIPFKYWWSPPRMSKGSFKAPPRPSSMDSVVEKGTTKFVPPPSTMIENPAPTFFLVAATDLDPLDQLVAEYRGEWEAKLGQLRQETFLALRDLRHQLFLIGLATFLCLAAGCFVLLLLGLRPLHRLSEAVSQINEKDFQLKLGNQPLPMELQPIADMLQQTLKQLERAFGREKQAAADISHELRTPLAALLTNLDVALRKDRTAAQYRELLEECRDSGRQMYHLVEHLLALARLDAGANRLRTEQINLSHIARQCANLVKPLAEVRGLALTVHAPDPILLDTDPDKLREILTNLLHNAIEYNRPNGLIDLAVERVNGHVELAVRDTGIGISLEAREHIFERFYRADPSRHADSPHAGLGLSIVKGYVELMGGTIDVQSDTEGTTFTVALPLPPQDQQSGQAHESGIQPAMGA